MQLTLDFDRGLADQYRTCRDLVAERVHHQYDGEGRRFLQAAIAAAMDYAPSQLSRKLTQSPTDSARFTLDDLESYMAVTGDKQPVYYLVEKYLTEGGDEIEALERRLAELKQRKALRESVA